MEMYDFCNANKMCFGKKLKCTEHMRTVEFSLNSVNHDKVQNWSGYQRQCTSGNRYITSGSNTKSISITISTHHIKQLPNQR